MTQAQTRTVDIALFMPSLLVGGAERVMLHLARGFIERGLQVDCVLAEATGPLLDQVPTGVRVVDLAAPRLRDRLVGNSMQYLQAVRPRGLISSIHYVNLAVIWARALTHVATPLVVREESTLSQYTRHTPFAQGQRLIKALPLLFRVFYPWADRVIAMSHQAAEDLVRTAGLPRTHVTAVYNPVVTPELSERVQASLDHPWFAPNASPVILGVGRLSQPKDYPTLIRAFAQVVQRRPARLMILGEGDERPQLEALIHELGLAEQVALPGYVANPYPYMRHAAVFVLSSIWEGLPGALIEAMACGAPVVATDCESGPREILEDGRYGPLVPIRQPEALAAAIEATLDAPLESEVLRRRANDFSLDQSVQQHLVLLGLA